jgi:hypothetical protein
MLTQSRKIKIKSTLKNPLSEKLKEKHQSSFIRKQYYKNHSKCQGVS